MASGEDLSPLVAPAPDTPAAARGPDRRGILDDLHAGIDPHLAGRSVLALGGRVAGAGRDLPAPRGRGHAGRATAASLPDGADRFGRAAGPPGRDSGAGAGAGVPAPPRRPVRRGGRSA